MKRRSPAPTSPAAAPGQQRVDERALRQLHQMQQQQQAADERTNHATVVAYNRVIAELQEAVPKALTVEEISKRAHVNLALSSNARLVAKLEASEYIEVLDADNPAKRAYRFKVAINSVDALVAFVEQRYPKPYNPENDRRVNPELERFVEQAIKERRVLAFDGEKPGRLKVLMANPKLYEPMAPVSKELREAWLAVVPQDIVLPDDPRWGIDEHPQEAQKPRPKADADSRPRKRGRKAKNA